MGQCVRFRLLSSPSGVYGPVPSRHVPIDLLGRGDEVGPLSEGGGARGETGTGVWVDAQMYVYVCVDVCVEAAVKTRCFHTA